MPIELTFSALLYVVALVASSLSNDWLSEWGRRLHLIHTYFHIPGRVKSSTSGDTISIDPFDFASLTSHTPAIETSDESLLQPVFDLGLYWLPHSDQRWLPDSAVFVLLPVLIAAVFMRYRSRQSNNQSTNQSNNQPIGQSINQSVDQSINQIQHLSVDESVNAMTPSQRYRLAVNQRVCCVLQTHAVVLLLRVTTSVVTVHRASPACHALTLQHASHAGFVLNSGCFDLMFSGHSAFCAFVAFFVCLRFDWNLLFRFLIVIVATCGVLANIVAGDHFTADCVVGCYIALLVAWHYKNRWQSTFQIEASNSMRVKQQ